MDGEVDIEADLLGIAPEQTGADPVECAGPVADGAGLRAGAVLIVRS